MNELKEMDLTELRRRWEAQREAMKAILQRIDPRGMTRPARDAEERAWMEERGERGSPFVEDEACAEAAREYYRRKYSR